ncbi:RHS repeat-associated core domain-containing protein [Streptomyces sp. URMC 127]|uniref:RHS repeat-associated core domain-containing protein n=1 Tax=Streptomyces sp. URMC 127 TaxID=3423402 RepID=UPI003F1999FF
MSILGGDQDKAQGAGSAKPAAGLPGKAEVRVLDRKASERAGVQGLLFAVTPQASAGAAKAVSGTAGVRVDYAEFAQAYGGGYASRLVLTELPSCALTTPDKAECRSSTPVPAENDTERQTLTAKRLTLRAGVSTVLAAAPAASGEKSDYKATPLSASAAWKTDLSTGSFGWSYNIPVPEVPGGFKPRIELGYSSSAIDGRTSNTNNQASWVGDGFDLWPGYIERRYKLCADDGVKNADGSKPGDLCWAYDNATISFNGKAGELVPAGDNQWRLKNDDGTKIARLTGSEHDNGDNDNEYWRVTTPDGTRYYFGYHKLNGWAKGKDTTDSTWTVPVFGNDTDEPCHKSAFKESWCQQAWRWNLDYAVDRHGNAAGYYYEKENNSYGRNLEPKDDTPYARGGSLKRIEYGLASSDLYGKALAKVDFTGAERCLADDKQGVTCAADTIDDKKPYWYDTPWDLNCKADTECDKGRLSPSFWTRKRLTGITTSVLKSDGSYAPVDSWNFGHRWGMADTDYQLLLDSVEHTGKSSAPSITLPKTTFAYTQRPNRLDRTGDGKAPFIKERLSTITDETGGQTDVTYSAPVCDWAKLPAPETNATRCFPQYIGGSSSDDPTQQWFNKYVVESVAATDRTGGAPDQVTRYEYLDGAAWHFDDDDGLTKEKFKTWSTWRGYGHVRVGSGGQGAGGAKSQEDTYFLRGMDGDRKSTGGGTKSVTVPLGKDEGEPVLDHESSAGFAYKKETYSGPGGKILSRTVNRPWHQETAKRTRSWGTVTANFTGTESARTFTSLDDGAGKAWRQTGTSTAYDTVTGRVTRVDDHGDLSVKDDDRCTRTSYADNAEANILSLPARVETTAGSCDTAVADRSKDVISDVRTAYDGGTYGAAPDKGDPTSVATFKKQEGPQSTYLETGKTFDTYGRELTATDITADVVFDAAGNRVSTVRRSDGRTSTITYTPATGFAATVTTATPPAKAGDATTVQTSTTTFEPLRGRPLAKTDPNGRRTLFEYDALGRSTKVWLPNKPKGSGPPSFEFTYTVTDGKPVAVGTRSLANNNTQLTSYTLYDGHLRPRQTQAPGPGGGRLIEDTFYDDRGLVTKTYAPYYATGAPAAGLFAPDDALKVETQTWNTYDGLGRAVESKQIAGNSEAGKVLSATRTLYGGDRITVIPPAGGTATTTVVDARGQTTELRQLRSRSPDAEADTTRYAYTTAGRLAQVTDPAGNSWTYQYDELGRQVSATDPDKGTTKSAYDDRNRLISTTSDRKEKNALFYGYDNLGRKTELREGSLAGPKVAEWTYDTVSGAKGQPASAVRYADGKAYITRVDEYDSLYRPTKTSIVIPPRSDNDPLAGTYSSRTAYFFGSGAIQSVGFPKAGSLPGAVAVYGYDDILRPTEVATDAGKAVVSSYSLTGKPLQAKLSGRTGRFTQITNGYEWGTQRLATSRVDRENVPAADRALTYAYDEAGNVRSISDAAPGGAETQCSSYDHLRRVTDEWTQGSAPCADSPAGNVIGGPAPYWNSYTYDKTGNRLTEVQHDTGGNGAKDTKRTYTFPPVGKPQPHALTAVDTVGPTGTARDSYTYDPTGNTATRTLKGDIQTLEWDAEGRLVGVSESKEGKTTKKVSYLYDADGQRLIGQTDTETTLYLGATEITLAKGASTPKATRYFDLGNGVQAVQTDDGNASFVIGDHLGTGQLAVDVTGASSARRRTTPFGAPRGEQPKSWPGTKGFVGGTTDTATGLTHLGAREYDPGTGRFLSVDPLMDLGDPQSLNGYAYANNSPVTFADPDGKMVCPGDNLPCYDSGGGRGTEALDDYVDLDGCGGCADDPEAEYSEPMGTGSIRGTYRNRQRAFEVALEEAPEVMKRWKWLDPCRLGMSNDCQKTPWDSAAQAYIFKIMCKQEGITCEGNDGFLRSLADTAGWAAGLEARAAGGKGPRSGLKGGTSSGAKEAAEAKAVCHSFTTGTDVELADGQSKNIEDVGVGDEVLATDPETGRTEPRPVVATIVTEDDKDFTDLTVRTPDGEASVVATDTHPFWVTKERRWTDAGSLRPGAELRTDKGDSVSVLAVRHFRKQQRTYDLTVGGVHTYYVRAGATPLLVHNCNKPLGFGGVGDYNSFVNVLDDGLTAAGHGGTKAAFQGSSVTGVGFKSGKPFGAHSDFDIALGGEAIFNRAKELGIGLRSRGTRTGPLSTANLDALGLSGMQSKLQDMAGGREVHFMIYNSIDAATARGPSILARGCGCG